MRVVVVAPPDPVVTWEEADAHLRLGGDTSQQPQVEAMVAAATQHLDAPDGWLGRALGRQALEARLDRFGGCPIALAYPPIVSIESVTYLDGTGAEQVCDADVYELRGAVLGTAWGKSWPSTGCHPEAVRIRYVAGYETLPAPIGAAILIMTADLYAGRDEFLAGALATVPMSITVERLLAPYRIWG